MINRTPNEENKSPTSATGQSFLSPQPFHFLDSLPIELKDEINTNLSPKALANASVASHFFYANNQDYIYWKNHLISAGCDSILLEEVIAKNIIKNYRNLYRVLMRLPLLNRKKIKHRWELLLMSGEINALQYAIDIEQVDEHTRNKFGENPLHFATLSGSVAAVKMLLQKLKNLSIFEYSHGLMTALHFSALSDSVEMFKYFYTMNKFNAHIPANGNYSLALLAAMNDSPATLQFILNSKELGYLIKNETSEGENILHVATRYGSSKIMKFIMGIKEFNALATTKDGFNVLHWAAFNGDSKKMRIALSIKDLDPAAVSKNGLTILHCAVMSSSYEAMQLAYDILTPEQRLKPSIDGFNVLHQAAYAGSDTGMQFIFDKMKKIDPLALTNDGLNILHLAVRSSSVKAMKIALSIQGINPLALTNYNFNVLHHAAHEGSVEGIKFVLTHIKNIDPLATTSDGRNLLHLAVQTISNVTAILFIRQLNLGLNPETPDDNGHDAFWHVSWFRIANPAGAQALEEALTAPLPTSSAYSLSLRH